jgi:DNA sulfur modification protein DndB
LTYFLCNPDHFYGALTVEVRPSPEERVDQSPVHFERRELFPGGIEFGVVTLDGTETLYALDGQHRLKALALAIRQQPQLAREQIALILAPFRNVQRSQSLFSDLNHYARAPSKSISSYPAGGLGTGHEGDLLRGAIAA